MTYKSNEKSFFTTAIEDTKEDLENLEKKGTKKALKLYDFGVWHLRDEIKRHPAQYFFLFISTFFGSVVTTAVGLVVFSSNILTFIKTPTHVESKAPVVAVIKNEANPQKKYDPLLLASKLRSKDTEITVIDIRSASDFIKGHILTAVNIPIYDTVLVRKNGELDDNATSKAFEKYVKSGKMLIIYAQNSYSTFPIDIVTILSSQTKSVKALAVGFEEWAHIEGQ